MADEAVILSYGDACEVAKNVELDMLAVRVQNKAFVEPPRWIGCDVSGGDRQRYLDELIWALQELRDAPDQQTRGGDSE